MFKVGQKVIAIGNGFNYGGDGSEEFYHNYAKGWTGVVKVANGISIDITFDNGRYIKGCCASSFEEVAMSEFKVGQKVTVVDAGNNFSTSKRYIEEQCPRLAHMYSNVAFDAPMAGQEYTIEHIGTNDYNDTLYFISDGKQVYIIGEEGVELVKTKFSVGDKVKVLSQECSVMNSIGYQGKITRDHNPGFRPYVLDNGYCYSPDDLELVEEPKEELMTFEEALKTCIDGHKVTSDAFCQPYYIYFDAAKSKFMVFNISITRELDSGSDNNKWKLYEEPKVQPKFPIGSTVIYRSNRHATVVDVKEAHGTFEYVLNADSSRPNCTFEKTEDELKEVK